MRSNLILGMCLLYLIQYFAQLEWLQYVVVILSLLAFLSSALKADRLPKIIGLVMMGLGIGIELSKGTGFTGISEGIFANLPLLCLITLTPLLSIPLRIGGVFDSVSHLMKNLLNQPKKLYAGITGTLFLLTPVLNLGSVRIINEFLEDLKLPPAMTAKSYVVGFATAVMWSPYFASVSLVLYYLNIPFKDYIVYGIGLSLLSLLVGNILFALWEKKHPIETASNSVMPLAKSDRNQIMKLALFVIILLGTCLVIESIAKWSMIVIVCLMSVIVPLIFGIISSDRKKMTPLLIDFRDRSVPMMNNEIMLFMSAGMLAFGLKGTTVMNGVSTFLVSMADISFFLFALCIMVIVLSITYIGVHQIAAVGAVAMQLSTVDLGMSDLSLALVLLLTWATSTAMSPYSGLNLMVSRFSQISGRKVGLVVNGLHLLLVAFIGIAIISFIV